MNGGLTGKDRTAWIENLTVYLREQGFRLDEVLQIVPLYDRGNEPPMENDEFTKIIGKAYSKRTVSCKEFRRVACQHAHCDPLNCHRRAPRHYYDGNTINAKYVAEEIMGEFNIATVLESGNKGIDREVYIYEDGYYKVKGKDWPSGDVFLRQEIQRRLHSSWKSSKSNEILKYIKEKTAVSYAAFDADLNTLNLKNGLFNITTGELMPHTPDYLSRRRIPVKYDKEAKCPQSQKFYHSVLCDEDTIYSVMQFMGYCLYNGMPIQRAFLLVGEPNSGKGTLLRQIRTLIGEENCCTVSLQLLENNQFAATDLTSKLVNTYGDMSPTEMPSVEMFRMLIGDDQIRGEYKGGRIFYFNNTCKFIFAANTTPKVRDSSDAYYRRWYIIPFDKRIPDDQIDINLTAKITSEEEISGLFNIIIPALRVLLEDGHFRNQPTVDESREMYEKASDPIMAFIDDMLEPAIGEKISKEEVYEAFLRYCKLYRLQTYGSNTFNRLFGEKAKKIGAEHIKKTDFGRQPDTGKRRQKPGWRDIRFIQAEEEFEEVDLR